MLGDAGGTGAPVVGRERELAVIEDFLVRRLPVRALLLEGQPGIGKTTLWHAAVGAAQGSHRVLTAQPAGDEVDLSFTALGDLLAGVDTSELRLPPPQAHALDVALLRAEPGERAPDQRAVAAGLLGALRALAEREPVLVAIDDVQWLDPASGRALAFAARRLGDADVRFVLAARADASSTLSRSLEAVGVERVAVGALSLGATRRLLADRLGLDLPRRSLARLFEASQGNPFFALELGRLLAERGDAGFPGELPVPETVDQLLGARIESLAPALRRALVALSLAGELRPAELAAIAGERGVDEALAAGLVTVEDDRVRAAHPLFAAAARNRSSPRERRELHLELAGLVGDPGGRALHLALATEGVDEGLAAVLSVEAAEAAKRAALEDAVELAEHALRLTPDDSPARADRLLRLAEHLAVAGAPKRLTALLAPELPRLPAGPQRGRAHLLLAEGAVTYDEVTSHLERALAFSEGDPALQATVLARKAEHAAIAAVERIPEAEAWALEANRIGRGCGPEVEAVARYALAWTSALRGRIVELAGEEAAASESGSLHDSPKLVAAVQRSWRGEIDEARELLRELVRLADERGEELSYAAARLHLWELELRAGEWEAAASLLDEWHDATDGEIIAAPVHERGRALLAAGRGLADEAERWAGETVAQARAAGVGWDLLEGLRATGVAALAARDPARAVPSLRAVQEHAEREGVVDPGAFPAAPDLVEALVDVGELGEARAVADHLAAVAERLGHPWGLVTARRCRALVRLASSGYEQDAEAVLDAVAQEYARLGLRFDAARTQLALGRMLRRLRKWASARRALEQAGAGFEAIGSPGWLAQARSELARVGGRRPHGAGELTPSERRVAALAAEGLANKEIARVLSVAVNTVEVHLSRAYAKLGVRSRVQLARRLSGHE